MPRGKKSEVVEVESQKKDSKIANLIRKIAEAGNKEFGEGTIFRGGDNTRLDVEAISTGSLSLDNAIGVGGLPKGRIIEISGPEASGKTMVSLSTIAEVQKGGGVAAFIDAEHALTPDWCRNLGVDFDNLLLAQPESGEKALSIMKFLVQEGKVDVIVLDSVAALVTQREIDGEMGDAHMAPTARLMSQALKKLTPIVSQSNTCCIFINQIRENVGQMFGSKEITPGGKALKFYSSVRLRVSKKYKSEKFDKNKHQIGHTTVVKVMKNKVAPPFREAEFDLYYNTGIDQDSEIVSLALAKGIITKSGKTYTYGDKEWVGLERMTVGIRDDKALTNEVRDKVRKALAEKAPDVSAEASLREENGVLYDSKTGEVIDEVVKDEKDLD